MIRMLFASLVWIGSLAAVTADEMTALARATGGAVTDGFWGGARIALDLSQGVPFRVFQLDAPRRLVVDFREVDFAGLDPVAVLAGSERVTGLRTGPFRPGWSRMVADLAAPLEAREIAMPVDPATGAARLEIELELVSAAEYAALARPPDDPDWGAAPAPRVVAPAPDRFVVVIDPGHGGVDPGAVHEDLTEEALMLQVGLALRDALRRTGQADVVMTRERDEFVSLPTRVGIANHAGADLFISLHADALSQGQARGATVYTLAAAASDKAAAQLAAEHDRADILAGVDLSGSDDMVAGVLMDLARQETAPRAEALAGDLLAAMKAAGGPVNSRPRREAGFSVLKSADIPSVLVELGFLSDKRDLENLRDPDWRAGMVAALAQGILTWRDNDAARRALVRQ